MNDKFDELAKNMAQSVTRRGALKKFGGGLMGIALASLGLANKAQASKHLFHCNCRQPWPFGCFDRYGFGTEGADCAVYCTSYCDRKSGV